MADTGGGLFSKPAAAGDNLLFVRLRWVLFLWILVDISVHYQPETWLFWAGCGIATAFGLSQIALWKLPPRLLKGLWLFQTIFLLDLFFTVATLYVAGQAEPRLLVVMFLTLFMTALVQRLSLSLLVSAMVIFVYAAMRLEGRGEFAWSDTRDLLDLPFLFIISIHSAVIVAEAKFHEEVRESLEEDNSLLAKKLGKTTLDLKDRVRFVMGAFDAVPAAVIVLDPQGVVRGFNTHSEAIFNVKRHRVLDRSMHEQPFLALLREELKRREGRELYAAAWLQPAKGPHFFAYVRNGIARDEEGALLNMAVFVSPTAPPAEAPTYEAYLALQKNLEDEVLQDSPRGPLEDEAGASGQASVALQEEAPKPKGPEGIKDKAATSSGVIQRVIAATVTTEEKD